MRTITLEDARAKLGELVDRARLAGESTVITRYGKPAAMLVPISDAPGAAAGAADVQPEGFGDR